MNMNLDEIFRIISEKGGIVFLFGQDEHELHKCKNVRILQITKIRNLQQTLQLLRENICADLIYCGPDVDNYAILNYYYGMLKYNGYIYCANISTDQAGKINCLLGRFKTTQLDQKKYLFHRQPVEEKTKFAIVIATYQWVEQFLCQSCIATYQSSNLSKL